MVPTVMLHLADGWNWATFWTAVIAAVVGGLIGGFVSLVISFSLFRAERAARKKDREEDTSERKRLRDQEFMERVKLRQAEAIPAVVRAFRDQVAGVTSGVLKSGEVLPALTDALIILVSIPSSDTYVVYRWVLNLCYRLNAPPQDPEPRGGPLHPATAGKLMSSMMLAWVRGGVDALGAIRTMQREMGDRDLA
jgi:hypothetical protein